MSIGHTLLGLLEGGPRHGYDLKRAYDERFGQDRPLHYGQVYATLSRLLRNGLVEENGVEPGGGPDRKRYAITHAGITDVATWLGTPEKPDLYLQSTLYTKVVLALLTMAAAPLLAGLPPLAAEGAIRILEFSARRPFHPERLHAAVDVLLDGVIRTRGRLWLANRGDQVMWLESAGGGLRVASAGKWLAAMTSSEVAYVDPERRAFADLMWEGRDSRRAARHASVHRGSDGRHAVPRQRLPEQPVRPV